MVRDVGVHGANDADVVNRVTQLGENLADLDAALATTAEGERRAEQIAGLSLGLQISGRDGMAAELLQHRLGVERVDLRQMCIRDRP